MKVKEYRRLAKSDLRALCIAKNWCTSMTNDEYMRFLNVSCNKKHITSAHIMTIAIMAFQGTFDTYTSWGHKKLADELKVYGSTESEYLSSMCFEIAQKCNSFFEVIE